MTSTKLIGRDTMIARLVIFHQQRIERTCENHNPLLVAEKKGYYSSAAYSAMNTYKICKEYDETFGVDNSLANSADFETPEGKINVVYSAALIG